MTTFVTHTIETAPEESKPILKEVTTKYGFVPNSLAIMAEAPTLLESYMMLNNVFDKTNLNEAERQVILMTNSSQNGCTYCMAAHTSISQMAKVPDNVIESLRTNTPIKDSKLEALHTFAIIINETRGWPSQEQVSAFLAAGYTKQTILEVIVGTSIKVLSNYTNHVAETKIDDAFASNAWTENKTSAK